MTATVKAIDLKTRMVTLKGSKGEERTIKVGEEAIQALRRAAFMSEDLKEGVRSFRERRDPVYQGK